MLLLPTWASALRSVVVLTLTGDISRQHGPWGTQGFGNWAKWEVKGTWGVQHPQGRSCIALMTYCLELFCRIIISQLFNEWKSLLFLNPLLCHWEDFLSVFVPRTPSHLHLPFGLSLLSGVFLGSGEW